MLDKNTILRYLLAISLDDYDGLKESQSLRNFMKILTQAPIKWQSDILLHPDIIQKMRHISWWTHFLGILRVTAPQYRMALIDALGVNFICNRSPLSLNSMLRVCRSLLTEFELSTLTARVDMFKQTLAEAGDVNPHNVYAEIDEYLSQRKMGLFTASTSYDCKQLTPAVSSMRSPILLLTQRCDTREADVSDTHRFDFNNHANIHQVLSAFMLIPLMLVLIKMLYQSCSQVFSIDEDDHEASAKPASDQSKHRVSRRHSGRR